MEQLKNRILNADVIQTLRMLPDESLEMIYGDPDYGVGIDYHGVKYTQKWEEYIDWYAELTRECMRVLKKQGNLFLVNYPKQNAYLRVRCLDEIAYDVQDYVWVYNTNVGHSKRRLTTAHRSILHATKSKDNWFYKDQIAVPYQNPEDRRIKERIANGHTGRMPYSWFYFDLVKNVSKDKTFHACQIPLKLVEMLIKSCTREEDNCFILFGGSGSELVLCRDLNRNFISCEIQQDYYKMILDRLRKNGEIGDEYRISKRKEKRFFSVSDETDQMVLLDRTSRYSAGENPPAIVAAKTLNLSLENDMTIRGNAPQIAQKQVVYNAVVDFCNSRGSRTFSLSEFRTYYDYAELGIGGDSPARTISRLFQELRDDGKLIFKQKRGSYTLINTPFLEGDITASQIAYIKGMPPERKEHFIELYTRNRGWVSMAKKQLGMHCLYPKCKNTFSDNKGTPYIEVHHIVPLFKGGEDGIWNLSVVCAHHHRMAHFADDKTKREVAKYLRAETEKRL